MMMMARMTMTMERMAKNDDGKDDNDDYNGKDNNDMIAIVSKVVISILSNPLFVSSYLFFCSPILLPTD
jgi:hypothetical protein